MHRLYHRFLRSDMTEEERDALSAAACRVLVSADPQNPFDTREWDRYAELIPHLEPAGALDSADPSVQGLVVNCVEYLRVRGEYRMGLRLCEQFMFRWKTRLAPTQRTMLVLTHQHANMLRRLGRYREAEAVGSAIVDELESERAERAGDGEAGRVEADADLLRAKDGLAGTLMTLGAYQRACDLFEEVAAHYTELLGPEAPRTVASRNNLAIALGLLGRYPEALALLREVVTIRERELRARHHLTLGTGTGYARMLRLTGRVPRRPLAPGAERAAAPPGDGPAHPADPARRAQPRAVPAPHGRHRTGGRADGGCRRAQQAGAGRAAPGHLDDAGGPRHVPARARRPRPRP